MWHVKDPYKMFNDQECRAKIKICNPTSPAMVTFPNEKKILDWDEKSQTNKKENIHYQ